MAGLNAKQWYRLGRWMAQNKELIEGCKQPGDVMIHARRRREGSGLDKPKGPGIGDLGWNEIKVMADLKGVQLPQSGGRFRHA